ncbi:MAG: TolC family protein [Halieaceae bacterium]|nr:TolC family protein [Halieaceae bacterium]
MEWIINQYPGIRLTAVARIICGLGLMLLPLASHAGMSISDAIQLAQDNDPWLQGSVHREQALHAQSTAAGAMPDPMVNLGFANLPTDSFDFDQEAMTQFKVGVTQTLPRGETLGLKQRQLAVMGTQQPLQRQNRKARVAVSVSHLWLDAYQAKRTIDLIEDDRALFEQLVDVAESSYATAVGKTRQTDLVRAQLELTRIEDRLSVLHERLEMSLAKLGEWLMAAPTAASGGWHNLATENFVIPEQLPEITLSRPALLNTNHKPDLREIASNLISHPAIVSLDLKIDASATGIKIAEQKYKPQWKLNASYGYRDDDPNGVARSDFFSVGFSFDVPLFTSNRQDQQVQSAAAMTEAIRTERALLLRTMVSSFETQRSRLLRLEDRRALYRTRLLKEIQDQADASLTAYTNEEGDFAEVVRSHIAELNARIDAFNIDVDRLKTIAQLNYFFAEAQVKPAGERT